MSQGKRVVRKEGSKSWVGFQDFASKDQNVEYYAEAKANQRREKNEADLTLKRRRKRNYRLSLCDKMCK